MTWVIDASVALKWVLEEEGTAEANNLLRLESLVASEFLLLECANILTHKARRGLLDPNDAVDRLRFIERAFRRVAPMRPHLAEAQRLSLLLKHSAYDCLHLATALAEGAPLVSADEELIRLAERAYPTSVVRLARVPDL